MKKFNLFILTLFISNVFSQDISNKYAETITSRRIKIFIYVLHLIVLKEEKLVNYGEILAVEFIRDFYIKK